MSSVNLTALEHLRDFLPEAIKCFKELGEKVEDIKDLIITKEVVQTSYMMAGLRDQPIKMFGAVSGVPWIFSCTNLHSPHNPGGEYVLGVGGVLMRSIADPRLYYIIYSTRDVYSAASTYFIFPKGKLFRYARNAYRLNKSVTSEDKPPVLEQGLLDSLIQNSVGFLLKARKLKEFGVRTKRGIILDGPPGNGKTMACRYIRSLCVRNGLTHGTVSAEEIEDAFNRKRLKEVFNAYEVTFFDDIDISYLSRKSGNGRMACTLLSVMDGMADSKNLVRIFTTNEKINDLDPAFIRPGRIDKCITFKKPTEQLRRMLITQEWPKEITSSINVNSLISNTQDYSFAELESIRTSLVSNYLMDNFWDLKKAMSEVDKFKREEPSGVGFRS
jgi:hypothetical protein